MEIFRMRIFRVGVFLIPNKIYAKNSQVYIVSVFSPPPLIIFSMMFAHPLVQLVGHVSALTG